MHCECFYDADNGDEMCVKVSAVSKLYMTFQ